MKKRDWKNTRTIPNDDPAAFVALLDDVSPDSFVSLVIGEPIEGEPLRLHWKICSNIPLDMTSSLLIDAAEFCRDRKRGRRDD